MIEIHSFMNRYQAGEITIDLFYMRTSLSLNFFAIGEAAQRGGLVLLFYIKTHSLAELVQKW
jgi:hypothetical protein